MEVMEVILCSDFLGLAGGFKLFFNVPFHIWDNSSH